MRLHDASRTYDKDGNKRRAKENDNDSDKKILPLCYKHIIAISSRKIRGKFH